ncbi:Deuterolysin metalloprotease family-domain-containing protein [Mycena rebaudengoi]|nr:Deuterolysin metalloprotease family-domain-containing protein [Mycena rebaudengoi]
MFRFAALLSFATLALSVSVGDLKVSLKAVSKSVSSIDDIVISAIVSNPTDSDIRVMNKNNVLDNSATQTFAVTKDGENIQFSGVKVTYDLSSELMFTTIPAGQSVAVNHTVASLFDFEAAGTGEFSFDANTFFQAGIDGAIVEIPTATLKIEVQSDVKKRELVPLERRQSTPTCADGGRQNVIATALAGARALAGGAAADIRSHPNSNEFNTYFGGNSQDDIWFRHDIIAGDLASSGTRIIGCTDPANICPGSNVIAYTSIFTSGGNIVGSDIFVCDSFFTGVGETPQICGSGTFDPTQSSKAGVILHELSHATSGTGDLGYGCSVTAGLSVSDKRNNADNYRCMGLAIYKHYNC